MRYGRFVLTVNAEGIFFTDTAAASVTVALDNSITSASATFVDMETTILFNAIASPRSSTDNVLFDL